MKKFVLGALLLLPLLTFAQSTTTLTKEQCKDVYLVFDRGDGISTYYRLTEDLQVKIDPSTTAVQLITGSRLRLEGFAPTQTLTTDIFRLLPKPAPDVPVVAAPVTVESDWSLGQYKNRYGSNYEREKNELPGGIANFRFFGQSVRYPVYGTNKPSTDELVVIALPTHSIVSYYGTDFTSAIEMKLTDQYGNVVWYLNDTKSGYHPSLKANSRGNNHPDDSNRWIQYGNYHLWVKNNSTDTRAVQSIFFGTEKGNKYIDQDLYPGQEATFELDIRKMADEYDVYKINCNVMPPR